MIGLVLSVAFFVYKALCDGFVFRTSMIQLSDFLLSWYAVTGVLTTAFVFAAYLMSREGNWRYQSGVVVLLSLVTGIDEYVFTGMRALRVIAQSALFVGSALCFSMVTTPKTADINIPRLIVGLLLLALAGYDRSRNILRVTR